jgi:hypothetical protein
MTTTNQFLKISELEKSEKGDFVLYRSCDFYQPNGNGGQYTYDQVAYHASSEAAVSACRALKIDVGHSAAVETLWLDSNRAIIDEEGELDLFANKKFLNDDTRGLDVIWTNDGEVLNSDGVIVGYSHGTYVNYCYEVNFVELVEDTDFKTESNLNHDDDDTMTTYYRYYPSVAAFADEFESQNCIPFDKLNKGRKVIEQFLADQKFGEYAPLSGYCIALSNLDYLAEDGECVEKKQEARFFPTKKEAEEVALNYPDSFIEEFEMQVVN